MINIAPIKAIIFSLYLTSLHCRFLLDLLNVIVRLLFLLLFISVKANHLLLGFIEFSNESSHLLLLLLMESRMHLI